MDNKELANIFYDTAKMLEADDVAFKPFAYRRAGMALEDLNEDVAEIYRKGGLKALEEIPGVGKSIAEKIEEYLKSGSIEYFNGLKAKLPVNLAQITAVEGVGPKRAKVLYEKLGVKTLADLEKAAREHKISALPGFGDKSEQNILQGIEFQKHSQGRFLLGDMLPRARQIQSKLESLDEIRRIDVVGSLSRRKETIGDIDFLAIIDPRSGKKGVARVMDYFTAMSGVEKVWGKGDTKSSVRMREGFNVDIRVLPPESYGAALQYFIGSKEHNVAVRRIAQEHGLKLSEYGLFAGNKVIAGSNEKEIYERLGMKWMPPEIRENTGEIQASLANNLPDLIGYGDLKGDLHCHSNWNGGHDSIEDIATAAKAMGYEYVGIADHTKFLSIENGLDEEELRRRNEEIDKLNRLSHKGEGGFWILKGCEANIMPDGSIDIGNYALAELDFVIAGVHSSFKMGKTQMTERIIRAMENPDVDIISHPTGRILKKRDEYEIDFERICEAAKRTSTVLEINSWPDRLDLDDQHIRRARDYGIKMIINTDSHAVGHMKMAEFGIAQARRGWAGKSDIVNAHPLDQMLQFLKRD